MKAPVATDAPKALSESQKAALVRLLADEDASIYQQIRKRILSYGQEAIAWVRPHTLSAEPLLRKRAIEVVQHLSRQEADNQFLSFCVSHGEDLDLEEGVWLLARTQYPDINVAAYQALFDSYAGDLSERLASVRTAVDTLGAMNAYLFDELGFRGNQEHYYDPENSYMNRVVDRRTGNPISLCTLYWLLGRRLRLPVVGIGLPGHFLCRYQSSSGAVFIDAFNRGKLLNRGECVRYLQQSAHGFQESFLAPVTPGRALQRMCANLHQICSHLELREEGARFQRYLVALAK